MAVYFNEIDPVAAQHLRNLIKAGHLPDGVVDDRSILDVCPADLREFTQCHFFAGVWSYAFRLAQWPDDRRVWSGSCPCQPFSVAGNGGGMLDQRHLWPYFQWLIEECEIATVVGEQVASKDTEPWLDLVQTDLEGLGFAFGAVAFPSAGVGAPHIRDRTYWMAHASSSKRGRRPDDGTLLGDGQAPGRFEVSGYAERCGAIGGMGDNNNKGLEGYARHDGAAGRQRSRGSVAAAGVFSGVEYANVSEQYGGAPSGEQPLRDQRDQRDQEIGLCVSGAVNGFWANADWLLCRNPDGEPSWRAVEPGTFPLAHGATNRMGRLRAYGNAINAQQAKIFIETMMEIIA